MGQDDAGLDGCRFGIVRSGEALRVGERLGRFQLVRELGRGSMGMVFLAEDTMLHEPVCVKVLHASLADHPEASERFNREIVLGRRISHKGVCRLHDIYADGELRYITMEYVEGEPLRDLLQPERPLMSVDEVITLVASICDALAAAHDVGVVHRDLKPRNIMVRPSGEAAILDFGIATALDGVSALTIPGIALGTKHYIAPEVWAGRPATTASDQYAVGVILYNCLTRRMPYNPARDVMLFDELSKGPPPRPSMHRADIPPALDAVALRALAFKPEARFATVRALKDALLGVRAPTAPGVPPWACEAPDPVSGVVLPPTLPSIQAPPLAAATTSESGPAVDALGPTLVMQLPTRSTASADAPEPGFVPSQPDGLPTSDASWVVSGRPVDLPANPKRVGHEAPVTVRGIADMIEPDLRPRPARSPGRLAVAILLGAVVIAAVIIVVGTGATARSAAVDAGGATPAPPAQAPALAVAVPALDAGAAPTDPAPSADDGDHADDEGTPGAAPEPDPDGKPRRAKPALDQGRKRYTDDTRALGTLVGGRGIRGGDDEELDRLRARAKQHAVQRDYDAAVRALEDASARVGAIAIDKGFVLRKLARFNDEFDKVTDEERQRAADARMAEVMTALAQSRYQDANDVLNRAFDLLR